MTDWLLLCVVTKKAILVDIPSVERTLDRVAHKEKVAGAQVGGQKQKVWFCCQNGQKGLGKLVVPSGRGLPSFVLRRQHHAERGAHTELAVFGNHALAFPTRRSICWTVRWGARRPSLRRWPGQSMRT